MSEVMKKTDKRRSKRTEGPKAPEEITTSLFELEMNRIFLNNIIHLSRLKKGAGATEATYIPLAFYKARGEAEL